MLCICYGDLTSKKGARGHMYVAHSNWSSQPPLRAGKHYLDGNSQCRCDRMGSREVYET